MTTGWITPPHWLTEIGLIVLFGCIAACATTTPGVRPLTTDEVLTMSKAGVSAAEIVRRMEETGSVYTLSASQLAVLRDQGVPDEVIDYMQRTYLGEVRRQQQEWDWMRSRYPSASVAPS